MKPHNKRMSLLAAALTGACSLLFFSCAKEAGPAGPQGPQGPAGAQGQAGPAGNANVKSYTLFITGSEWTNDGNYSYVTKQLPEISADIISKGTVMAYYEDVTVPGKWYALPFSYGQITGHVINFGYYIETGKITFELTVNDNASFDAASIGNSNMKIVVIEGSSIIKNPMTSHRPEKRETQLTQ